MNKSYLMGLIAYAKVVLLRVIFHFVPVIMITKEDIAASQLLTISASLARRWSKSQHLSTISMLMPVRFSFGLRNLTTLWERPGEVGGLRHPLHQCGAMVDSKIFEICCVRPHCRLARIRINREFYQSKYEDDVPDIIHTTRRRSFRYSRSAAASK